MEENKIQMTSDEKERLASFMREQENEWDAQEARKVVEARIKGDTYEPQPFQGFNEETALQFVRNGWKSKLDKRFEKKRRQDIARGIKWGSGSNW